MRKMRRWIRIFCLALILIFPSRAAAETVAFPFFIDFPLLRTLVLQKVFGGPGQSAQVVDQHNGCQRILLSDPAFREKDTLVQLETGFYARMGAFIEPQCILPIEYEGYLSMLLRPVISRAWVLRFQVEDLTLYETEGHPLQMGPAIAPVMTDLLTDYIEHISFDLRSSIDEVKYFIMPLIPESYRDRAKRMLQSMHPESIITTSRGLQVEIAAEVEAVYQAETDRQRLTELDLEAIIQAWEALDVFLVELITSMSVSPLSASEKHGLTTALLESRYDFVTQWSEGSLNNDFVRKQFKKVWRKISKILRQHLNEEPPDSALRHLAFYTASEVLSIVDKIGPSLGIKVSRDGLLRLAQLLTGDPSLRLDYQSKINRRLREIFGLGKTLPPPRTIPEKPVFKFDQDESPHPEKESDPTSWLIPQHFVRTAWAQSDPRNITFSEVRSWLLRPDNTDIYFPKVRHLLNDASHRVTVEAGQIWDDADFFERLVLAVAWQESCFRQFIVKDQKIVFLRSYNGTSVGLMQVNERVWRGIYDLNALRWDIRYNAQAGCEIVNLYLRHYALADGGNENRVNRDTLARLVYALYNGGPGELSKFMHRHEKEAYFLSDRLFYEKYRWVMQEAWEHLDQCVSAVN